MVQISLKNQGGTGEDGAGFGWVPVMEKQTKHGVAATLQETRYSTSEMQPWPHQVTVL